MFHPIRHIERQSESAAAFYGFLAGALLGLLTAAYVLATLLIHRDRVLQELAQATARFGAALPAPRLYLVALVVTPPVVLVIHVFMGMFYGDLMARWKQLSTAKVLLSCVALGAGFGLITNTPAPRAMTFAFTLIAWQVFGVAFVLLNRLRSKPHHA